VIENENNAVIVYDPERKVKYWNQGAERIYGFSCGRRLVHTLSASSQIKNSKSSVVLTGSLREICLRVCGNGDEKKIAHHTCRNLIFTHFLTIGTDRWDFNDFKKNFDQEGI
jgi:PAS domain-containing protein